MKALVKLRPEKGIWMCERPIPTPGINEVLVKINKTSICGTDLHIYKWDDWSQRTIKTPMIIGHEYADKFLYANPNRCAKPKRKNATTTVNTVLKETLWMAEVRLAELGQTESNASWNRSG
jgi:hypothetical protein